MGRAEARISKAMAVFMFTDIEGSTRLWQRDAEAMAVAMKEHDAILSRVVAEGGGQIVKSTGDGVMAVFEDVTDALDVAVRAEREMQNLSGDVDLKIRIGVHCGDAEKRGDDWFGSEVNKAARLADCGHGGQVLVSAEALSRIDPVTADFTVRDLGRHPLRDIDGEHHLFQVESPGLVGAFPPLRTSRMAPNNLPTPPTRLVGRLPELRGAHDALHGGARLVTLSGPGGMGKTRLALQVATDALGRYSDGVWFVELAPLSGPSVVLGAISVALGLSDRGSDVGTALRSHLRDRQVLLILDNFEHVVAEAPAVADLLSACSTLNVVATSRVPLRIRGERIVAVPPLAVPEPDASAAEVLDTGAGQLFVERARDAVPGFEIDEASATDVAAIVRAVEGIPLALEISAGRLLDMGLKELRNHLLHRLDALSGGPRDLPERHQALRSTIEWSWDLLGEEERVVLRRISVLPGGVTVEAAAATSGFPAEAAETILERLSIASLLTETTSETGTRWAALESVREFALEKLTTEDDPGRVRSAAAHWVTDMAVEAQELLHGAAQGEGVAQLAAEIDNVREALRELLEVDPIRALRLAEAISRWWVLRGQLREGIAWLEQAVERAPEDAPYFRPALTALAALAGTSGDHAKAAAVAERAVDLARAADDETSEVIALNVLGALAIVRDDYGPAEEIYQRSRDLLLPKGKSFTLGSSTNNLGLIFTRTDREEQAIPLHEEALAIFEELGDLASQSTSLKYLGTAFRKLDRWEEAEDAYSRAIKLSEAAGHRVGLAEVLTNLALVRAAQGESDDARALLDEAWARAVEAGSLRGRALVCQRRATLELDLGNREEAARQWHKAADLLEEAGSADAKFDRERARRAERGEDLSQQM